MNIHLAARLFLASLTLATLAARADSLDLQPVADTALLEGNPDNNLGAVDPLPAGTTATGPRTRALFRFDLTQIPPGASITSATLTIQVTKKNFSGIGSDFTLHRLLKDWGEGTGIFLAGTGATNGEASWNNRFHPSTPWSLPGGEPGVDYAAAGSSTNFLDDVGSYTFPSTPAMVADLQAWAKDPSTNFGWILITESEGTNLTARRIASREDAATPPKLSIQYTAGSQPPPPAPPVITNLALVANQIRFSFNIESNRTYAVEFRPALDNSIWTSLTNIPAQPAAATISVTDPVSGTNRFYRVRTP
jgi:hypothetical protein